MTYRILFFCFACALYLCLCLAARASDLDAKAALALASASQPKAAPCPPECPCGCQEGHACTCAALPKDGARDGEWTYDASTRKWWKYQAHDEAPVVAHVPITPPQGASLLPGNVCAPVAQPALLFSPPTHQAPAPVYSVSPRAYAPAFRPISLSMGAGWGGGSFSSGGCGPGG